MPIHKQHHDLYQNVCFKPKILSKKNTEHQKQKTATYAKNC